MLGLDPLKPVGSLVKTTLDGLASANRQLKTGGTQLAPLQLDQARDLLEIVHKVTNRRLVLVVDQFEKSAEFETEIKLLDNFLRHLEQWPPCHIFLGMIPGGERGEKLKEIQLRFSDAMRIYELPQMHLQAEAATAFLRYLRDSFRATAPASDEELLGMVSGNPGVIYQWAKSSDARQLDSLQAMLEIAHDANNLRFVELAPLLGGLPDIERVISMRIALLPSSKDRDIWGLLEPVILGAGKRRDLDSLKRKGVLEGLAPATYGHIRRGEAALSWYVNNCYSEVQEVCEELITGLSEKVRGSEPASLRFAISIAPLTFVASELNLSELAQILCDCAQSMFSRLILNPEKLIAAAETEEARSAKYAPLLAIGLVNGLFREARESRLATWERFTESLFMLGAHREDPALGSYLLTGLMGSAIYGDKETLLNVLRRVAASSETGPGLRLHLPG
jgi:hypothetical protein